VQQEQDAKYITGSTTSQSGV